MTKILSTATLTLVMLTALPVRADDPVRLKSNHRLIVSEARGILSLAHPTVRYTGIENDGRDDYRDGSYRLSYILNFNDGGDAGYRVIRFSFDKAGKLVSLAPGNGSSFVPAFLGSDLVLEILKGGLKDPKYANDPVVKELLKVRSAQDFLLKYLQWRQGS
jgi:hypothetical protein